MRYLLREISEKFFYGAEEYIVGSELNSGFGLNGAFFDPHHRRFADNVILEARIAVAEQKRH